jgi:hypothetical protein
MIAIDPSSICNRSVQKKETNRPIAMKNGIQTEQQLTYWN